MFALKHQLQLFDVAVINSSERWDSVLLKSAASHYSILKDLRIESEHWVHFKLYPFSRHLATSLVIIDGFEDK